MTYIFSTYRCSHGHRWSKTKTKTNNNKYSLFTATCYRWDGTFLLTNERRVIKVPISLRHKLYLKWCATIKPEGRHRANATVLRNHVTFILSPASSCLSVWRQCDKAFSKRCLYASRQCWAHHKVAQKEICCPQHLLNSSSAYMENVILSHTRCIFIGVGSFFSQDGLLIMR
jgi:hypothetical protein